MNLPGERLDRVVGFLWGLTLLCLPVTSFPYLPFLGSETQVRPLSIYPLLLLAPLLVVQMVQRRVKVWQPVFALLGVFLLLAVISIATGILQAPLDLRGQDFLGRALRAVLTLMIGLAFFAFAVWVTNDRQKLLAGIRWLYLGLFLTFLWGMLQLAVYSGWALDEEALDAWQKVFSISGISLKNLRVPGFALEPSWLAGQMAVFYMPWLFAALLSGYRVTRWRWLEFALLGMALFLLVVSYSRSGLVMALAACLLTAVLAGGAGLRRMWQWWKAPIGRQSTAQKARGGAAAVRVMLALALLAGVVAGFQLLAGNPYFARIWQSQKRDPVEYVVDIYAGPRLAYAWSGMNIFAEHPWSGVGLGATGLYLYANLPDWSKTLIPEIATQISPRNASFPNTKNMFIRILAEMGVPGLAAFAAFLFYALGVMLKLRRGADPQARFLWVAGLFSWIVVVFFCFTQDSFAMPNTWINLGMFLGLVGVNGGRSALATHVARVAHGVL